MYQPGAGSQLRVPEVPRPGEFEQGQEIVQVRLTGLIAASGGDSSHECESQKVILRPLRLILVLVILWMVAMLSDGLPGVQGASKPLAATGETLMADSLPGDTMVRVTNVSRFLPAILVGIDRRDEDRRDRDCRHEDRRDRDCRDEDRRDRDCRDEGRRDRGCRDEEDEDLRLREEEEEQARA